MSLGKRGKGLLIIVLLVVALAIASQYIERKGAMTAGTEVTVTFMEPEDEPIPNALCAFEGGMSDQYFSPESTETNSQGIASSTYMGVADSAVSTEIICFCPGTNNGAEFDGYITHLDTTVTITKECDGDVSDGGGGGDGGGGTATCADSDGGYDKDEKGTVETDYNTYTDYCLADDVYEYYCSDHTVDSSVASCDNTCQDGMCVDMTTTTTTTWEPITTTTTQPITTTTEKPHPRPDEDNTMVIIGILFAVVVILLIAYWYIRTQMK